MTGFRTALEVEARKARASWTMRVTGLLVALGIPAIVGAIIAAARGGGTPEARAQLLAKLGPDVVAADWHALVLASTQVTAAASVLAFGVAAAWLVGREFVDGTVPALFGLPVGRAVWRPAPDFHTSAAAWITAGAAHHTAMSTAIGIEAWADWARIAGTELLVIDQATTLRAFEDQLRANAAYYRLARGI